MVVLTLLNHAVDLLLGKTALVIGDGNRFCKEVSGPFYTSCFRHDRHTRLASALVVGRHLQNTIGVEIKSDLDLRNTTRRVRDASELELAEEVVVLGH